MAGTLDRDVGPLENRRREPLRIGLLLLLAPGAIFALFGLPLALRTAAVEAFETDGGAMDPTLLSGERFMVDKSAYGLFLPFGKAQTTSWRLPQLGDVVVAMDLGGGNNVIKRVIGLPGDVIEGRAFDVLRNGSSFTEREIDCPSHLQSAATTRHCYIERLGEHRFSVLYGGPAISAPPRRVPKGQLYLIGDHRDASRDSRNPRVGTFPSSRTLGRATRIYWSAHHERIGQVIE